MLGGSGRSASGLPCRSMCDHVSARASFVRMLVCRHSATYAPSQCFKLIYRLTRSRSIPWQR